MRKTNSRSHRPALATAVAVLVGLVAGCGGEVTPEIVAGIDGCSECGMVIDQVNQACGWVNGGDFEPFCSPACLLSRYDDSREAGMDVPPPVFFADYRGGGFSSAEDTVFLLTGHISTVMNSGVITFPSTAGAEAVRQHDDEIITDWIGYRVLRGRPNSILETTFTPTGMEPSSVAVAKGDIVLWRAVGGGLEDDLVFRITGYPEVEPATVSADGGTTELRFLATRPGAGFPVESLDSGEPLGMLKVVGAHTADEAVR